MNLQLLSLNSIHKNGEDEYTVTERLDGNDELYVRFRKVVKEDEQLIKEI